MNLSLIGAACLTGFIGDALLQLLSKYPAISGPTAWGLNPYFEQHGSVESLFIAGGMMTLFYVIYIDLLNLNVNYINLIIYGIVLDYIFRVTMLFPSLKMYYEHLNYFWSAFWGAIPMILPLIVYNFTTLF
jgi:hypothetical protein